MLMGKRRFAQVSSSEDDEEEEPKQDDVRRSSRRGKRRGIPGAADEDDGSRTAARKRSRGSDGEEAEPEAIAEEEKEPEPAVPDDAKPIGDVVKVTGKGKGRKNHYASFEYDGNSFELEDSVLLSPEDNVQKPYVAVIKDITQDAKGNMMVTGQWFYRPEEAGKKAGGSWQTRDTRELFYSFHLDDVPAESVMHKCVVHFIPHQKQLPVRSQHPGFIVQKVYDVQHKKLWKLTDEDYEDSKQKEINVMVQKTRERIGDLPDIESEDAFAVVDHQDDQLKSKWNLRRKNMHPLDVSRDDSTNKTDLGSKADTPGSCSHDISEYQTILSKFKVLTRDPYRDKWLEKLLQGIQFICNRKEDAGLMGKKKNSGTFSNHCTNDGGTSRTDAAAEDIETSAVETGELFCWPDAVIPAITALERVSYESLGSDFQKYNQKMRQLDFNLKNNGLLARRLLNNELEPQVIVNMSPNELKDGLTAEEKSSKEPEKPGQMQQMTDARCSRCMEKNVGVADIIQAGGHGDRYQLECIACGHQWYAARDTISSLTIDTPSIIGNVGTAPWATAKFENVAKKLTSPRDAQKAVGDDDNIFQKPTAPNAPVLETQKSLGRSKE